MKILYKKGDWVVPTGENHTKNNSCFPINIPFRIKNIELDEESKDSDYKEYYIFVDKEVSKITGYCTDSISIRHALYHEIPIQYRTEPEYEIY